MTLRVTESRGHRVIEDRWDLVHHHALGKGGEAFVAGVERGELIAAVCPSCSRTLLPPRGFCERCFKHTEFEAFEARTGELLSFTIVRRAFTDGPPVPFAFGYVKLAGADTAIGAMFTDVDLRAKLGDPELRVGMEVELQIGSEGFGMERLRLRPRSAE
jgi:uncharacterized OB-fold protein